ncbi:uncharacterized protein LOC142640564 isoform X2 [Castanea sativa]|uniref:uncharacterized protein LOC142640564 isoform X2 n=1 Tax=Castanea sativa TaxID=21020 RepID=UPI003F64CAC6
MPSRLRTKKTKRTKSSKKMKNTTNKPTYHSPPNSQLQGIQGNEKEVDVGDQYVLVGEEEVLVGEEEIKEGFYSVSAVSLLISAGDSQMEEASNGKIEDTQKVEYQEENVEVVSLVEIANGKLEETQKVEPQAEFKEVAIEDFGEVKAVDESVTEILIDENSESVDQTYDGSDSGLRTSNFDKEEKSSEVVDSGKYEEEEKVVSHSVADYVVPIVEELDENLVGLESKENEEKIPLSLEKSNGISPVKENEEVKEIEETKLPSSDENDGSYEVAKETTLPALEEDGKVPEVVKKGIEETELQASDVSVAEASTGVYESSKEDANDSLQPLANAPAVDTSNAGEESKKTEIPESTGNPHIISVSQRPLQPTSWRSCCGLFEVLRRSDR